MAQFCEIFLDCWPDLQRQRAFQMYENKDITPPIVSG